jgi:hypothetical protein
MDGKLPFASSEQDKQHNDIDMDFYIDYTQKNLKIKHFKN